MFGALMGSQTATGFSQNFGNLWVDKSSVSAGMTINATTYTSGFAGELQIGDVISNSYSLAQVTSTTNSAAGLIGSATGGLSGLATSIVNSYFAGTLTGGSGTMVAAARSSGKVLFVNTATLSTLTPGLSGATVVSSTNASTTDAQFKNISTAVFSSWLSPPWSFSNGSYPTLSP